MRYTKQRKSYNCGPVAILNAMRWAGQNENLSSIEEKCKCEFPYGTQPKDLNAAIDYYKKDLLVSYKRINPSIDNIKNHLRKGGIILYRYLYYVDNKVKGHYSVIDGLSRSEKSFYTVNQYGLGKARQSVREKMFINEYIYNARTKTLPNIAWFIRMKNEI